MEDLAVRWERSRRRGDSANRGPAVVPAAMLSIPAPSARPGGKGESTMPRLRFTISMSLDGYVAGPRQSVKDPLGIGGEQLHEWVFPLAAWRAPHGLPGGEV